MRSLRWDMDGLAIDTWRRVALGDARNIRLREDTVTELNLLELDVRHHPRLQVHRFNQYTERRSGGDWEWLIGTGQRWLALRIQAKRMDDLEYRQLQHPGYSDKLIHDDYQYDTLIRTSAQQTGRATFPYYVFFNGWPRWPAGLKWHGCPNGAPLRQCTHAADLEFGCSVMPAGLVKSIHRGRAAQGRKVQEYLPYSVPWSWLFGFPPHSLLVKARHQRAIAGGMVAGQTGSPPRPSGPPPWIPGVSQWSRGSIDPRGAWDRRFDAPMSTSGWAALDDSLPTPGIDDLFAWHQAIAAVVPTAEALEADAGTAADAEDLDPERDENQSGPRQGYWSAVFDEFGRRLERRNRPDGDVEGDREMMGLGPLPEYANAMQRTADMDESEAMQILRGFDSQFGEEQRTVLVTDLGPDRDR